MTLLELLHKLQVTLRETPESASYPVVADTWEDADGDLWGGGEFETVIVVQGEVILT